LYVLPIRSLA